jgi:hypothetical protein
MVPTISYISLYLLSGNLVLDGCYADAVLGNVSTSSLTSPPIRTSFRTLFRAPIDTSSPYTVGRVTGLEVYGSRRIARDTGRSTVVRLNRLVFPGFSVDISLYYYDIICTYIGPFYLQYLQMYDVTVSHF